MIEVIIWLLSFLFSTKFIEFDIVRQNVLFVLGILVLRKEGNI